MKRVVSSRVSLLQGQQVGGYCLATGSPRCCFPPSHLASASADFPFFEQNCSAVVVPHHPFLVSYVDCRIGVPLRNRFHQGRAQVSLLALHLVLPIGGVEDRGRLPETMD